MNSHALTRLVSLFSHAHDQAYIWHICGFISDPFFARFMAVSPGLNEEARAKDEGHPHADSGDEKGDEGGCGSMMPYGAGIS